MIPCLSGQALIAPWTRELFLIKAFHRVVREKGPHRMTCPEIFCQDVRAGQRTFLACWPRMTPAVIDDPFNVQRRFGIRPKTRTGSSPPRFRTGFPDPHTSRIANACRVPFTLRHTALSQGFP